MASLACPVNFWRNSGTLLHSLNRKKLTITVARIWTVRSPSARVPTSVAVAFNY